MQSDPRIQPVLAALAAPCARFLTALEAARDQMTAYLAVHRAQSDGRVRLVRTELGPFARGRIDSERFAALSGSNGSLGADAAARIDACVAVIDELLVAGDALHVCDIPPGGDMRTRVNAAFAGMGRAFGAVLGFQAAKTGAFREEHHGALLAAFPFARWNRAERLLAPPLVIDVDGADLDGAALAPFLDGGVKVVVMVRGASAPAPLARLVGPGTMVLQGDASLDLSPLAAATGPAVAAVLSAAAAQFVHLPREAADRRERLRIISMPADVPGHALGGQSAWQQREELGILAELARTLKPAAIPVSDSQPAPAASIAPAASAAAAAGPAIGGASTGPGMQAAVQAPRTDAPAGTPVGTPAGTADDRAVDTLAAWLLSAAGLAEVPAGGAAS